VTGPRTLPALEANRELIIPPGAERTLDNGLTVIAIERRSVPLVELRLRMPFERARLDPPFVARAALLSQTLFSGTDTMSTVDIAAALQAVGGALSAGVDADRLLVTGNGLASGLGDILGILSDVLTGATYPEGEVETERARLIDRVQVAQSQPSHLARVALQKRMYGEHPYAVQTPSIEDIKPLGTPDLAALHDARVHPTGATLVIVGDVDANATLELATDKLAAWNGFGAGPARCRPRCGWRFRRSPVPTRTTPRCSWPTWSSAATSPPGGWRTSVRTRVTPTARTPWSSTRWPDPRSSSAPRWRPR
jgi:zinc protease